MSLSFIPRLPVEELLAGYRRVLGEIYSPKRYFERCAALIDRLPNRGRPGQRIGSRELRAVSLSLLRQTFSHYGWHYLRFLGHTLLRRPRLFPVAVALAVKGHHFITITREIPRAEAFSRALARLEAATRHRVRRVVGRRRLPSAAVLEGRIEGLLLRLRRRYGGFGEGMQQYVAEAFERFSSSCRRWVAVLRRMRLPSGEAL